MTNFQKQNFEILKAGEWISKEYFQEYYGLNYPFQDELLEDFKIQTNNSISDNLISRYKFESFMKKQRLIPKKWMSASLGMTSQSLDLILNSLRKINLVPKRYIVYPELICESFSEDLIKNLGFYEFSAYSDRNIFIEKIHTQIKKNLEINVDPLFCTTSIYMKDNPKRFAINFDCITMKPICEEHKIGLNFNKPLYLRHDFCSKLFYLENLHDLKPYLSNGIEPHDLDLYIKFNGVDINYFYPST